MNLPDEDTTVENSEGAATSTTDDNNVLPDSSTEGDANNQTGDTKDGEQKAASVEDTISDALSEHGAELEEDSPASKDDQENKETDEEGKSKEDADLDSRLDKHPRFQEVIAEKNALSERLKAYEPLETALKDSTMNEADRVSTLQLGDSINRALIGQANPQEVLNSIQPILEALQNAAGLVLPEDIQKAVDEGHMSPEYAASYAKERASHAAMQNSAEFENERKEAEKARETSQYIARVKSEVLTAVSDWETQQMNIDPDYEQKRDLIYTHIQGELQSRTAKGLITSPQDALVITKSSLEKVNILLGKALPNKSLVRPNLQGGSPSSKVTQKATTIDDAIGAALDA